MWFCGVAGFIGAFLSYRLGGVQEQMFKYTALAGVGMVVLFLVIFPLMKVIRWIQFKCIWSIICKIYALPVIRNNRLCI